MAIIGTLPYTIADGQDVDATPVQGNFAFIVSQVNANAQPTGGTASIFEWISTGLVPTFISGTSFRVAADVTTTLLVGRRLQTINTGGTLYSTVTAATFSSPNTTVTVANDSSPLDSGLSAVSYGILSPVNRSVPSPTAIAVHSTATAGSALTSTVNSTIGSTGTPSVTYDALGEWSAGVFTCNQAGTYSMAVQFYLHTSVNAITALTLQFNGTGVPSVFAQDMTGLIPGSDKPISMTTVGHYRMTAGQTLWCEVNATFASGSPHYKYAVTVSRIGA